MTLSAHTDASTLLHCVHGVEVYDSVEPSAGTLITPTFTYRFLVFMTLIM